MINPKTTEVLAQWNIALAQNQSIPVFCTGVDALGNINLFVIKECSRDFLIETLQKCLLELTKDDKGRIIQLN